MTDLADELEVTLPAVDKHLRVLLEAGLVTKTKQGRTTTVRLTPGSLHELAVWALSTRLMWTSLLDRYVTTIDGALDPSDRTLSLDPTPPPTDEETTSEHDYPGPHRPGASPPRL